MLAERKEELILAYKMVFVRNTILSPYNKYL